MFVWQVCTKLNRFLQYIYKVFSGRVYSTTKKKEDISTKTIKHLVLKGRIIIIIEHLIYRDHKVVTWNSSFGICKIYGINIDNHAFLYSILSTLTSSPTSWYTYVTTVADWMSIKTNDGITALQKESTIKKKLKIMSQIKIKICKLHQQNH